MFSFFLIAYLPFIIVLSFKHDIITYSLSHIGWRIGDLKFLLLYVICTVPFMIYQASTFIALSKKRNRFLRAAIFISGLLITVGSIFPVKESSPQYSHLLHSYLCQAGSVLSILAVTYMVAFYCKDNKRSVKKVAVLYAQLLLFVIAAFILLYTAAIFEAGASFLFLLVMFLINASMYKCQKNELEITGPENVEGELSAVVSN